MWNYRRFWASLILNNQFVFFYETPVERAYMSLYPVHCSCFYSNFLKNYAIKPLSYWQYSAAHTISLQTVAIESISLKLIFNMLRLAGRHFHSNLPIGTLHRWGLVALHGCPAPPSLTALTLNSYSLPSRHGTVALVAGITPPTGCQSLPFSLFSTY